MLTEGIDDLTELVIGCAIRVHDALGPGLLESIYRDCLVIELIASGLKVEVERCIPIEYRGQRVRDDLRLDLLVDARLVVDQSCRATASSAPSAGNHLLEAGRLPSRPAAEFQRGQLTGRAEATGSSGDLCREARREETMIASWSPGLLWEVSVRRSM
jgi:GxxExxY protein